MAEPHVDIDALTTGIHDYHQAFETALKLHSPVGSKRVCPTCKTPWPCRTTRVLLAPAEKAS